MLDHPWLQLSPKGVSIRPTVTPIAAGAMGTLERPTSVPFPPAWSPTKGEGCSFMVGKADECIRYLLKFVCIYVLGVFFTLTS